MLQPAAAGEEPAAASLGVRGQRRSRRAQRKQKLKRKREREGPDTYTPIATDLVLGWADGIKFPRLILGSQDSLDLDVVYIFPSKPPVTVCYKFCDPPSNQPTGRWKHVQETPEASPQTVEKEENRNIILLNEDGVVYDCFKGIPDAIHNCLYYTCSLHTQLHPNPCITLVHRNVPLRIVKGLRDLVGMLCKTEQFRQHAKQAIKSNSFMARRQLLSNVDFVETMKDNSSMGIPALKIVAFHFAQMIALMRGQELFTKAMLSDSFPDLRCFLYRSEEALTQIPRLNSYRDTFLNMLADVAVSQKQDIAIFSADVSTLNKAPSSWNLFAYQCRGMVIDIKKEFCVSYPFDNYYALDRDNLPAWPCDEDLIESECIAAAVSQQALYLPSSLRKEAVSEPTTDRYYTCFKNLLGDVVVVGEEAFELPPPVQQFFLRKDVQERLRDIDYARYSTVFNLAAHCCTEKHQEGLEQQDHPQEQRSIVASLILIGVRDRHTWKLLPSATLQSLAEKWGTGCKNNGV